MIEAASRHLSQEEAFGNGGGITIYAEAGGGSRLGSSAVLSRGRSPGDVGQEAAEDLVEDLSHGGCVDRWYNPPTENNSPGLSKVLVPLL
jgi:RNA 3'-terminal phosphate cyclase (ATP)